MSQYLQWQLAMSVRSCLNKSSTTAKTLKKVEHLEHFIIEKKQINYELDNERGFFYKKFFYTFSTDSKIQFLTSHCDLLLLQKLTHSLDTLVTNLFFNSFSFHKRFFNKLENTDLFLQETYLLVALNILEPNQMSSSLYFLLSDKTMESIS